MIDETPTKGHPIASAKLSDLLGLPVTSESGKQLGKVHDVHCRRTGREINPVAGRAWVVDHLLVGRRGVLVRYGFPLHAEEVAWSDVVKVDREGIVVRDGRRGDTRA